LQILNSFPQACTWKTETCYAYSLPGMGSSPEICTDVSAVFDHKTLIWFEATV